MSKLGKFAAASAAVLCAFGASAVEQVSSGSGDDAAAITAAITAAAGEGGDGVVQLAPGTYTLASTVTIDKSVTVKGLAAAFTTITASGTGYSLFKLTNAGAVLANVTLTGATALTGAGVYVEAGTVRDAIVVGNASTAKDVKGGGGVWLSGADCALRRCRIENNASSGWGAGVYAEGASVIESCSFVGNVALYGGGLFIGIGSTAVIAQCSFRNNVAMAAQEPSKDVYNYRASGARYLNCVMELAIWEATDKCQQTGCLVKPKWSEADLSGQGESLAGETVLEGRDLSGTRFRSADPSIGCTEFATDGLKVIWTGPAFGLLGSSANATFAYENRTDAMAISTALYDPAGTCVGGSETGEDFDFAVTDVIGGYTLVVAVTDGDVTTEIIQRPFCGGVSELHVSPTGASVSPYATEATALTDIQEAVDLAAPVTTVVVHDGEYPLTETLRIERPVTVRSANGRGLTTLRPASADGIRLVYVNNAAAVLDGFTLTGGRAKDSSLTGDSHGGGVYVDTQGGTVDNCLIENCGIGYELTKTHGVAVRLSSPNSVLRRTIVRRNVGNTSADYGSWGSVYLKGGGVVDNCLIYGNSASYGAGVYVERDGAPGVILNSTILDNDSTSGGEDLYVYSSGSAITNSIIGSATYDKGVNTSAGLLSTALFKDRANGDYTPLAGDAAVVDRGVTYDGMAATDVYGNPRLSGDGVDIGAAEFRTDALLVELQVDKREELFSDGLTFTLTPTVTGAKGAVSLDWRITADNGRVTALETTTANEPLAFTPDAPGNYSVSVVARQDAVASEPSVYEKMFVAGAPEAFVDERGGDVFPYVTAATAARDFGKALELATSGSVIRVAAGTYVLPNALALSTAIQIVGAGRDQTTLRLQGGVNDRVAALNHPQALVRGCTLSGGRLGLPAERHGCGVWFGPEGGTVEDCRITDNKAGEYLQHGGGVAFAEGSTGVLRRTVVDGNSSRSPNGSGEWYGGGIYTQGGGVVEDCLIVSNQSNWGGGIFLDGTLYVTNCTVVDNSGGGAALYAYHNWKASRLSNLILRPQAGLAITRKDTTNGVEQIFSHCAIEGVSNTDTKEDFVFPEVNGNTHALPLFVDAANGNYHQTKRSPLRGVGLVTPGLRRTADLDGRPRVSNGVVDLGCYQLTSGGMLMLVR